MLPFSVDIALGPFRHPTRCVRKAFAAECIARRSAVSPFLVALVRGKCIERLRNGAVDREAKRHRSDRSEGTRFRAGAIFGRMPAQRSALHLRRFAVTEPRRSACRLDTPLNVNASRAAAFLCRCNVHRASTQLKLYHNYVNRLCVSKRRTTHARLAGWRASRKGDRSFCLRWADATETRPQLSPRDCVLPLSAASERNGRKQKCQRNRRSLIRLLSRRERRAPRAGGAEGKRDGTALKK